MKKIFTLGLMMLSASLMFGQATHTIDFEFEGVGADWEWSYCCNGSEGSLLEFVDNPDFTEPNVSDIVATFTCKADGDPWALFQTYDNGEFTFDANNAIVKIMVYKPILGDVAFKVQGSTGTVTTLLQANTVVDAWEEVTFDCTALIGETYSSFAIFPSNVARTEDVVVYVDNIQVPKGLIHEAAVVTPLADIDLAMGGIDEVITLSNVFASADLLTYAVTGGVNTSATITDGVLTISPLSVGVDELIISATTEFDKIASDTVSVTVGYPVGIEPNSIMDFIIAPNPSNGKFSIQLVNEYSRETEVTIFNIAGQIAHQQMVSSSFFNINVSELNAGLYFLQISNMNGKNLKKITIK